ncbi:MAG: CoA-binding protein [Acidobacteriia bacterium]|nr:CoA-binding protein [Terriglobia bacterium]
MNTIPQPISEFLAGKRFAVAGVSRDHGQAANAIFQRLKDSGYEVFPLNPNASELEGTRCYADVSSLPGVIDGVIIATHPDKSDEIVKQCADRGIPHVWFHRSIGNGSLSQKALDECRARGVKAIVGGCPLMFCGRVDFFHKWMCRWLQWRGRVPK